MTGSVSLVFERPFAPYPLQELHLNSDYHILFNRGRVPFATWNRTVLASNMQPSSEGNGNSGFVAFSPKFLNSEGWSLLRESAILESCSKNNTGSHAKYISEIVTIFSEEESGDVEWAYGSFPLEEYIKALDRAKGELYYNHSLGMQYSKVWILHLSNV